MDTKTLFRILLSLMIIAGCSSERYGCVKFHGTMRERYILDTITIENPLLVIYGSDLFVIRKSYLEEFVSNPSHRPQGVGQQVFDIIPGWSRSFSVHGDIPDGSSFTRRVLEHIHFGYHIYNWRDYNSCVVFKETRDEIEVYEFVPEPSKFALELVAVPVNPFNDEEWYSDIIKQRREYLEKRGPYINKLDSLECRITLPSVTKYVITVEPIYSRETINRYIDDNGITSGGPGHEVPHPKLSKRTVKLKGLPDL